MTKLITTQKQRAKRLIIGGLTFIGFVLIFLSYSVIRIPGFGEILPSEETAALLEFPVDAASQIINQLEETLKLDWQNEVVPWAGEKAGVAFLNDSSGQLTTLLLIQIQSIEDALAFTKTFRNPSKEVEQIEINGITAFSTPNAKFVFLSDNLVIVPTLEDLKKILNHQTRFEKLLSGNRDFAEIQTKLKGEYRIFLKPNLVAQTNAAPFISSFLTRAAFFDSNYRAVGVGATTQDKIVWQGNSYALLDEELSEFIKEPYRAKLLPLLPPNPDFVITGQNLARHVEQNGEKTHSLIQDFANVYFPNTDPFSLTAKLFSGEFAYVQEGGKKLIVLDVDGDVTNEAFALREAFGRGAIQRTTKRRQVTLPDGSAGFELIPNADGVKASNSTYRGVPIYGIEYGENERFYDAVTENLWIVGNNLIGLQEVLARSYEDSERENFQTSAAYTNYLQPILRNPDFIGFGRKDEMRFGISKRTFIDHAEASFVLR